MFAVSRCYLFTCNFQYIVHIGFEASHFLKLARRLPENIGNAERSCTEIINFSKLGLPNLATYYILCHFLIRCSDPLLLCPPFYVRKVSGSSGS